MWPFWHHYGYWGWGMPFGSLFGLLLTVFIILAICRPSYRTRWRRRGLSSGLALLEERYARGEIDREEYLQKKSDLLG